MQYTIHEGDCRVVLPTLPTASVHVVATSPPYWAMRDYSGTGDTDIIGMEATVEAYIGIEYIPRHAATTRQRLEAMRHARDWHRDD